MKKGDFVETMYGALHGLMLEVIEIKRRYHSVHGALVLCETGGGRRYWLRSSNIKPTDPYGPPRPSALPSWGMQG